MHSCAKKNAKLTHPEGNAVNCKSLAMNKLTKGALSAKLNVCVILNISSVWVCRHFFYADILMLFYLSEFVHLVKFLRKLLLCFYSVSWFIFILFLIKGHDQSSTLAQHSVELTLPNHHPFHRDLLRYAKLMEWLKNTDYGKYEGLTKVREVLKWCYRVYIMDYFWESKELFLSVCIFF